MRPLSLAGFLVLSLASHAAELRFFTEHARITTSAAVHVENEGESTAFDLVVEITLSEGLRFRTLSGQVSNWSCSNTPTTAVCRKSALEPRDVASLFFEVNPVDNEGGHHSAIATLTARNTPKQTVVFDAVANRFITVTTTGDSGAGSLRAAIEEVNEHPICGTDVTCSIFFARDGMTIAPATPLPPIRKCNVALYGNDGWEVPRPVKTVTITGEKLAHGNGLEIRAACPAGMPGVTVGGFALGSFPGDGIYIASPGPHTAMHAVGRSHIGLDATGLIAKPNGGRGIVVDSPHDSVSIYSSIISGNSRSGVALYGARKSYLGDLKIGVDRENEPMGNGASGIFSFGTPAVITHGIIAHNAHFGIAVAHGTADVVTDWVTIHSNGGLPIDWGLDDRTPSDDETDGILNAPQILSVTYEPFSRRTLVKGVVRLRAGAFGERYRIETYIAASPRGDVLSRIPLGSHFITPPTGGAAADVPFEIEFYGDYLGKLVTLQTQAGPGEYAWTVASEFSEGVEIR